MSDNKCKCGCQTDEPNSVCYACAEASVAARDAVHEATVATTYPCAGAADGCRARVRHEGSYCRRCAIDADP